jgi:hypothetical protein
MHGVVIVGQRYTSIVFTSVQYRVNDIGECNMPRKKKETVDSLKLDFTGQMVAIFDVEGYGPIEIRLDDKETTLAVLKTILEYSGNIHDVDSYTAAEGKRLKKLVEGK